jgi:uncharacterized protein
MTTNNPPSRLRLLPTSSRLRRTGRRAKYINASLASIMLIIALPALAMDPNYAIGSKNRTLWEAAFHGNVAEVSRLIELNANVNFADARGFTPLMAAAQNGHIQVVQILLDHKATINAQASKSDNIFALISAAGNGHEKIVQLLLDKDANPNMVNAEGITPLMIAAQNGYLGTMQALLEHGANPAMQARNKFATFALRQAACKGNAAIVRLLVDKGAPIDMADAQGVTSLILAAQLGRLEVVQILLDCGANVHAQAAGLQNICALMQAAQHGHDKIAQLLLDQGADANITDSKGLTPLMLAAKNGHLEVVKILLKNGAQVNAQATSAENLGAFALAQAALNNHRDVVEALLTTISDADAQAIRDGYYALLGSIGPRGVNAPKDMRTFLADHFINALVQEQMKKAYQILVLHDSEGNTARFIALQRNHQAIADLLDLGRKPQSRVIIRKIIELNIRQALKARPISKYPNARGITWDEALGSFEQKRKKLNDDE